MQRRLIPLCTTLLAAAPAPVAAEPQLVAPDRSAPPPAYERTVRAVADMVSDNAALEAVSAAGLQLLNVLWEDTGRWEGSSVGPNISDVTIEVEGWRAGDQHRTYLMPVMRHANFTDKTADVRLDRIQIPVGNHAGGPLQVITLKQLLENPLPYLSAADRGKIQGGRLLAERDSHALVSAQHAFLPVPQRGQATFWPVIFNYQSTQGNPAVLTILVTRQGTSITVIDNARDTVTGGRSWGQRLYFNQRGEKAPLIAQRLADVRGSGVTANGEHAQSLGDASNVLMLIQVPLRYRERPRRTAALAADAMSDKAAAPMAQPSSAARGKSDVDVAVLGHGATEGPFTELAGLTIARDARFPVRVTLQFYQATSNGVVSRANVEQMAAQIRRVYAKGDYVGSLVVPSGLDRRRPTASDAARAPIGFSWTDMPGLLERYRREAAAPGPPPMTFGIR